MSHPTPRSFPGPPSTLRDPHAWVWGVVGLAFMGFGVYVLVKHGWNQTWGLLCLAMGACVMPWLPLGVLGGLGLLGFAVWLGTHAVGTYDFLLTLISAVVGGGRLLEAHHAVRARRAARSSGPPGQ
jgi:hypothetical protein